MSMDIYEPLGFSVEKAKTLIGMVLESVKEFYDLQKRFSQENPSIKDPSKLYEEWKTELENSKPIIEVEGKKYKVLKRLAIDEYWYGLSEITNMRFRDFFSGDPLRGIRSRVPFGFILQSESTTNDEIYIVFRGTQTKPEWYNNLRFNPGEERFIDAEIPGRVHSGFHHIYTKPNEGRPDPDDDLPSIMGVIQKELNTLKSTSPNAEIYITGHSLGAALATLAAAYVCEKNFFSKPPVLYTFASPRVGDKEFSDYISENLTNVYRVINSEDIISAVPLASPRLLPVDDIEQIIVDSLNKLSEPALKLISLLPNLDFYHVGKTIAFTTHKQSILENHIAATYQEALYH